MNGRRMTVLSGALLAALTAAAETWDVRRLGARPDGTTDNTAVIQKAIDACAAQGGGRVLVPGGGVYKTYTLSLRSDVELHIDRGATLKGGEDPLKYPEFGPTDAWRPERAPRFNRRALFYTVGQTNVAITGAGTIDGSAELFHRRVGGRWRRVSDTNITGRCVFFVGCRDVRLDGVRLWRPSGWSTWFLDCDRVACRGVRIECPREFPNGDGLHFGGCRDVTVSDCLIDAQDDALVVRTHQEQMRRVRPCERLAFANCVLRSNCNAIRIGWTGDGPIRDVSFDNIVCADSGLGVEFVLPKMPDAPAEWRDPPRGRGLLPPPESERVPFSVENVRFSNLSIASRGAPITVAVGASERVAFLRGVSFSHCRFTSTRPPTFDCRPEDNVSGWRFSDVTFDIARPRGQTDARRGGVFENVRDFAFDNVRWNWLPRDTPEWSLVLERLDDGKPVVVNGVGLPCSIETQPTGARRFTYDAPAAARVRVTVDERRTAGGVAYAGTVANDDPNVRVTAFRGPFLTPLPARPDAATLYLPQGLGRRIAGFPKALSDGRADGAWKSLKDGRHQLETGLYPSNTGMTMPWAAVDTGFGTWYVGAHETNAAPKRLRVRWSAATRQVDASFEHALQLSAGGTWRMPETVCERVSGDWHATARRYRAWYDTAHRVRAAAPDWTRDVTGWLLAIMRQQNGEVIWPYADIPTLCDVAARHGLDCLGLFGWAAGGHDHLYPDYEPSDEMGGVAALKAGLAEARRRGIRVCLYANGQLQQVGATAFWRQQGEKLALVRADGTRVIQTYHKYTDIPTYEFALACLHARPWLERMTFLAQQAEGLGADALLFDQWGTFAPFACHGTGHGHPTPSFSHAQERPGFARAVAARVQAGNPDFAIFTEGLHDSLLDSVSVFHAYEYGAFLADARRVAARAERPADEVFPELWRYTFPDVVSTLRAPMPAVSRTMANYAAVFGFVHDLEVRYAPDRAFVLEGRLPSLADYGTVRAPPDLTALAEVSPTAARAYLKAVCDFQRAHAKYLRRGRFADDEGFACPDTALLAKRFVAADGTSAVCVWNLARAARPVRLEGLGEPSAVYAPDGTPTSGALPVDSLRLLVFADRTAVARSESETKTKEVNE